MKSFLSKLLKRETVVVVAALGLLAGVVAGREKPALEIIEEQRQAKPAAEDIDLSRLQRPQDAAPAADPFAARAFGSEKQHSAQPQQRAAPPLPFRYFGKVIEDGKLEVFVMNGDDNLSVKAGARIGDYRVDKVSETSVTFTYLPLNTRQTLDIPAVN